MARTTFPIHEIHNITYGDEVIAGNVCKVGDASLYNAHDGNEGVTHQGFMLAHVPKVSPVLIMRGCDTGPPGIAFVRHIREGIKVLFMMMVARCSTTETVMPYPK